MSYSRQLAIDTSVLIALINPADLWHSQAIILEKALLDRQLEPVYFDCVAIETISAITRRLQEKKRGEDTSVVIDRLMKQAPLESITWILPETERLYIQALDLIRVSKGSLNFNDALIALACRERSISILASFDTDFDMVSWLQRLSRPEDLS
jgi:predicted nucleic acid-binding protein